MRRVVVFMVMLVVAFCGSAQVDTLPDTSDSQQPRLALKLGVSGGATLFSTANESSPYYSKYGFFLQIPFEAQWWVAPHWKLSTGLRYDFNWCLLYYNVEVTDAEGLDFRTTPTVATHHNHLFSSYVGIPLRAEWFPWAEHRNVLSLAVDIFAGYAVNQNIIFKEWNEESVGGDGVKTRVQTPLQPWKLEAGLSLFTSMVGLSHGVRLFANLLPTYKDPATGKKIYTAGISLFL